MIPGQDEHHLAATSLPRVAAIFASCASSRDTLASPKYALNNAARAPDRSNAMIWSSCKSARARQGGRVGHVVAKRR